MEKYNELKNYQTQLLNLKEVIFEDNPELKEELQKVTNSLKQFKKIKKYERLYTKEELRQQVGTIRTLDYLIEQQKDRLFTLTESNKVQDSFYKTNISILGLNIERMKEYKKELKKKIQEKQIFLKDEKKISNNWRFGQC